MTTLVFVALGLGAGLLTTLAGQGGGLLLLLACAALVGPREALAITSPALLLGNLHRMILLRRHVDRAVAARMILGALPGGLIGGMLSGAIPTWGLRALLVVITLLAFAKAIGLLRFRVPPPALVPAGFVVGVMTGTSGGAGVLFAPVLLSTGLTGTAFVATSSAIALATHIGRVSGYASLGMFAGTGLLLPTAAVTVAIFGGNWAGERIRSGPWLGADEARGRTALLEYGMLVVCVALSVAGLG